MPLNDIRYMATINYRIKKDNEWNSIFIRFREGYSFDYEISTKLKTPKDRWSQTKQCVLTTEKIDHILINTKLKELQVYIHKEFESSKLDNSIISNNWFKEKINVFFNRKTGNKEADKLLFFTDYIKSFIELSHKKKSRNNTPIKKRTIQHYNTTLKKILAFENFTNKRLLIDQISLEFHGNFIDFLESEQKLNPNTIGGYIDDIKLFCSNADKKKLNVLSDYKLTEFYTPSNKTKDVYLKEEEINLIYNKVFKQDHLDNARDWFVIGLWTGLRVSDLLNLSTKNINGDFIYQENFKTGCQVIIPIHEQIKAILNKRNGEFPRKLSGQKFNAYIKIVSEKAGITEVVKGAKMDEMVIEKDGKIKTIYRKKTGEFPKYELVSSHICRRSFASNLYGKLPSSVIMNLTGHKTENQFNKYIKITSNEHAETLQKHWDSQKNI